MLRNIRHGTWGTLPALTWPWFLISSWIFKFCTFASHSGQVTPARLSNSPLRKCCFCGQPLSRKESSQEIIILSFFHHHQVVPELPPPSLVTLMCSYFKERKTHTIYDWLCLWTSTSSELSTSLKSGGTLGDTGGVPVGPQGVLVRRSLSRAVQPPLCVMNLRLDKETLLLLWGKTELASNADPLQISSKYPKRANSLATEAIWLRQHHWPVSLILPTC